MSLTEQQARGPAGRARLWLAMVSALSFWWALDGAPLRAQPSRQIEGTHDGPLIVKRHSDKRTLLRGDLVTGRTQVLYRSRLDVLSTIRVAPRGRFTAVLETAVNETYERPPRNQLVLLDATGQPAHRVERDVQTYVFSPDGKQLAYVVGRWYEGGVGFVPTALYILDLDTWQERRVPEVTSPYDLHWLQTEAEDVLLSRTLGEQPPGRVVRYDVRRRRASVDPSGDFHLSPDGRYVLKRADELIAEGRCNTDQDVCVQVRERQSGRIVDLVDLPHGAAHPVDWVYDRGHLLLLSRRRQERRAMTTVRGRRRIEGQRVMGVREAENVVLDVATGRAVERPTGVPLVSVGGGDDQWVAGREHLLLRTGGPADPVEVPNASLRQRLEVQVLERQGTSQRLLPRRLDLERLRETPPPPRRRRDGGGT